MIVRYFVAVFVLLLPVALHAAEWVEIPEGSFLMGSTPSQIEAAYRISAAGYGHEGVREAGWFDHESPQQGIYLPSFRIQKTPVTQAEYAGFVHATQHAAPFVDAKTWRSYGLAHPYHHVLPYLWGGDQPPADKGNHPVVVVSYADARAYAVWLSQHSARNYHLPSHAQWEKAMRGSDGRQYPWGDAYDARRLNNSDRGPFATTAVGAYPNGASPYGVLDGAGQVFEWTASQAGVGMQVVKGGSWDDHGGVCRPAAFHSRPVDLKHILIGFRLVEEIQTK